MDRRSRPWIASGVVAVVVLALAALLVPRLLPAAAADQPVAFNTIQVGPMAMVPDPNGTAPTLRVRTGNPLQTHVIIPTPFGEG